VINAYRISYLHCAFGDEIRDWMEGFIASTNNNFKRLLAFPPWRLNTETGPANNYVSCRKERLKPVPFLFRRKSDPIWQERAARLRIALAFHDGRGAKKSI